MDPIGYCFRSSLRGIKHFQISKRPRENGFFESSNSLPIPQLGATRLVCKLRWTPKGECRGLGTVRAGLATVRARLATVRARLATVRARLAWSHLAGSKRPVAARVNHTPTPQLGIKFWEKSSKKAGCRLCL